MKRDNKLSVDSFSYRLARGPQTSVGCEALEARTLLTGADFADRGWVSVIVDETMSASLNEKLARFKQDLVGDGWRVAPIHTDAPRMDDENYVWKNQPGNRGPITNANFGEFKQLYIDELQEVKDIEKLGQSPI